MFSPSLPYLSSKQRWSTAAGAYPDWDERRSTKRFDTPRSAERFRFGQWSLSRDVHGRNFRESYPFWLLFWMAFLVYLALIVWSWVWATVERFPSLSNSQIDGDWPHDWWLSIHRPSSIYHCSLTATNWNRQFNISTVRTACRRVRWRLN